MWPFDYFRSKAKLQEQIDDLQFDLKCEKLFSESVTTMYEDSMQEVAILRQRIDELHSQLAATTNPVKEWIVDRPPLTKATPKDALLVDPPIYVERRVPPSYTGTWVNRPTEVAPTTTTMNATNSNDMLTGMILGQALGNHHNTTPTPSAPTHRAVDEVAPVMKMEEYTTPLRDPDPAPAPTVDHTPSQGLHGSPSSSYSSDSGFSSSSSSSSYDSGSSFSDSGFSSSSDF